MTPTFSIWPLIAILVSLLGALPIILSNRQPNLRESWTILIAVIKLSIVASLLPGVLSGESYVFTIAQVLPGVPIELRVDALGMVFALVASCLWLFTSIYSIGYMRALDEHAQTRYFASFAVAISATIGIAFSANLLTMYLFYEVLSLSTYPLVTHEQNAEARASGRKYLTYIIGTSIGLALPAMLMTYLAAGTLNFTQGGILAGKASPELLALLLVLFLFGFAKAGLFLAIGIIQQRCGHDRIRELDGTAQRLPATTFAIALGGVALIGLPPSGAFLGKWQLIGGAFATGWRPADARRCRPSHSVSPVRR